MRAVHSVNDVLLPPVRLPAHRWRRRPSRPRQHQSLTRTTGMIFAICGSRVMARIPSRGTRMFSRGSDNEAAPKKGLWRSAIRAHGHLQYLPATQHLQGDDVADKATVQVNLQLTAVLHGFAVETQHQIPRSPARHARRDCPAARQQARHHDRPAVPDRPPESA